MHLENGRTAIKYKAVNNFVRLRLKIVHRKFRAKCLLMSLVLVTFSLCVIDPCSNKIAGFGNNQSKDVSIGTVIYEIQWIKTTMARRWQSNCSSLFYSQWSRKVEAGYKNVCETDDKAQALNNQVLNYWSQRRASIMINAINDKTLFAERMLENRLYVHAVTILTAKVV